MEKTYNLNRFLQAQETTYDEALSEITKGKKQNQWKKQLSIYGILFWVRA
jgi:uncharacterized protein (DUF1810 family)